MAVSFHRRLTVRSPQRSESILVFWATEEEEEEEEEGEEEEEQEEEVEEEEEEEEKEEETGGMETYTETGRKQHKLTYR